MALQVVLEKCAVSADQPGEMAAFLKEAGLLPESALDDGSRAAAAMSAREVPSVEALRRFWRKLGTAAQRNVVHLLAATEGPVTIEELAASVGGRTIGGTLGGLSKNAVEFAWAEWLAGDGERYELEPRFHLQLVRALHAEGVDPCVPPRPLPPADQASANGSGPPPPARPVAPTQRSTTPVRKSAPPTVEEDWEPPEEPGAVEAAYEMFAE